jgi:hypothetical protein
MAHMNFLHDAKILYVEAAAAAGTTELVTDVVDTTGFESIAFVVLLGDVTDTSVLTLTAKTNSANSVSSPTPVTLADPVTFTAGASNADNKLLVLDLHRPRDRYVFASLTRTTANAVVNGIIAILYNAAQHPVTQDAVVIASKFKNDPPSA